MLKGTEKQINWANDIKSKLLTNLNQMLEATKTLDHEKAKIKSVEKINNAMNQINSIEEAKLFIEKYSELTKLTSEEMIWELGKEFEIPVKLVSHLDNQLRSEY